MRQISKEESMKQYKKRKKEEQEKHAHLEVFMGFEYPDEII